jgi:acetyl-CoA decarbonylase/synthase complex subunit beta
MIFRVGGEKIEKDLESIIERRNHALLSYISGLMHLNQRYDIWMRVGKNLKKKGVTSWKEIYAPVIDLYKAEMPFIEKMDITIVTDPAKVKEELAKAMAVYHARDERAKGLHDEDVDVFYGCTLCQAFAPTSACVVTPDRPSLCGAITWFDGRAAAKVDPEGPQFAIEKGTATDEITGEYTAINEMAEQRSGGEYSRMLLYTFFEAPHTSCGCFETIGFYMPEVDGIGLADRDFKGATPNGLPFSTMAGQTGGGKQVVGFLGMGILYYFSPKFLQADGGWRRIVWMSKGLKERVKEGIDADMVDKIATEDDANDIASLKAFLLKVNHPVVDGVTRKVDNKKITEGWKLEEVDDDIKEKVIAYIEKTGGDINIDTVKSELGLSEGQFMQVVEALQEDGVLE